MSNNYKKWLGSLLIKRSDSFAEALLEKSREDIKVHPTQRKQFRQERRSFEGQDPLAQETGNKLGVSNIGIETRRADPKQKGVFSHGYARVGDPKWHGQRAKKYHQQLLTALQEQPKPKLEKSNSEAPKVNINPEHGKIIANAYENMKHQPSHPQVKAAYNALANETGKQYQQLLSQGFKFSKMKAGMENPYKTSKEMHADIANNKHLWYFPTEQGYGSEGEAPSDHPLLAPSAFKDSEGKAMLHNDIFRIVHDINGHHKGGQSGFGPRGEHQAYLTHKKMYSPLASKALASETMGQNSAVNFGIHGEHNRKNPQNTIYAEQKAGLLPDNIINGRWHE
jgi:hypothetical protein